MYFSKNFLNFKVLDLIIYNDKCILKILCYKKDSIFIENLLYFNKVYINKNKLLFNKYHKLINSKFKLFLYIKTFLG